MQKQCYLTVSIREAKLWPKEALTVPAKGSTLHSACPGKVQTPARVLSPTLVHENNKSNAPWGQ